MNSKTRQVKNQDHFVAPYDAGVSFDELPDSAPSSATSRPPRDGSAWLLSGSG